MEAEGLEIFYILREIPHCQLFEMGKIIQKLIVPAPWLVKIMRLVQQTINKMTRMGYLTNLKSVTQEGIKFFEPYLIELSPTLIFLVKEVKSKPMG